MTAAAAGGGGAVTSITVAAADVVLLLPASRLILQKNPISKILTLLLFLSGGPLRQLHQLPRGVRPPPPPPRAIHRGPLHLRPGLRRGLHAEGAGGARVGHPEAARHRHARRAGIQVSQTKIYQK